MAANYPIKKDLFRFATLRSPQHIANKTESLRFVFHAKISSNAIAQLLSKPVTDNGLIGLKSEVSRLGEFAQNTQQIQSLHPTLYSFSTNLFKGGVTATEILNYSDSLLNSDTTEKLFNELYYQVLFRESNYVQQACLQMLIANHILKNAKSIPPEELTKVQLYRVVIPQQVVTLYKKWKYGKEFNNAQLAGVQQLGVADYRRVEQEVCCYVPGEVSHIENILAKEYKERSTRNLVRSENTFESSRDTESESLKDTSTVTRNELNSEIATILEQDRS